MSSRKQIQNSNKIKFGTENRLSQLNETFVAEEIRILFERRSEEKMKEISSGFVSIISSPPDSLGTGLARSEDFQDQFGQGIVEIILIFPRTIHGRSDGKWDRIF